MAPQIDDAMDSVSRNRLESGLAQIEANTMEEREQWGKNGQENSDKTGQLQSGQVAEHDSEAETPNMRASSKEMKEERRLNRMKRAVKGRLREDKRSNQRKKAEKMKEGKKARTKKDKTHKERKDRKEDASKLSDDITDHPEDISILDNEVTEQSTKDLSNSMSQILKPIKVTRIVPMKIGGFWVFPTADDLESKPTEQDANLSSSRGNFLLTKKRSVSTPEINSDDDKFHQKRAKIGIDSEEIITPTPASRAKRPRGGPGSQLGRSPHVTRQEVRDGEDGLRSPSYSDPTSTSSSSSDSGLYIETLRASFSTRRERDDTPVALEEVTCSEDYENVPDTWQDGSGKIRGRPETSEDTEIEENLAFSSHYISTHPKGVTMSGVNFKIIPLAAGSQFTFDRDDEAPFRVVSVAQGIVEVTMCGKVFRVQEDGMWRLRTHEQCTVKNQGTAKAVVHVSSIKPA